MSIETSVRLRYLQQNKRIKISELVKIFPKFLKYNIYIYVKLADEVIRRGKRKIK